MAKLSTITLPDGNTYDLYWPGSNPDSFTGSIDSTSITPGIYELAGVSVNGKSLYGTFTQYGDAYKTQVINAGVAGESRVYTRRYLTGSSSWTAWSDYTPYGLFTAYTPTFATPSGVTINRSRFMRLGPMVWVYMVLTMSSNLSSGTNIYSDMPIPDDATDFPAVGYTNDKPRTLFLTAGGYLRTGQAWPSGSYCVNGWYYSPS